VRIIDGILHKGSPFEIPDCGRDDLPQFFVDMGYKVGAEIGVLRGEFTERLCRVGLKMYGVDPYRWYGRYRRHPKEEPAEAIHATAVERLAPYDFTLIKKFSRDALADFADGALDFVYIDANHTLPFIIEDIWEWNRKVRVGGVLSGHDYGNLRNNPYSFQACHVQHAVDLCAKVLNVPNYYILGEYHPKAGEKRDKWRSWLWLKEG
jgi:hypothetical protein